MSWVAKWNEALHKAQALWDAAKHPRGRDGKFIEVGDHVKIFTGPDSPQVDSGVIVAGHLAPDGRFFAAVRSSTTGEVKWYRPKQIEQYKPKANLTPSMPIPALENMTDEVPWEAADAAVVKATVNAEGIDEMLDSHGASMLVGPGGSLVEKPKPVPSTPTKVPKKIKDVPGLPQELQGSQLHADIVADPNMSFYENPNPDSQFKYVGYSDDNGFYLYDDVGDLLDQTKWDFQAWGQSAFDGNWPQVFEPEPEPAVPDAPGEPGLADWQKELLGTPPPKMVAGTPLSEEDLGVFAKVYKHPQGATIVVFPDGSMLAYDKNGEKKTTSATPLKLANGHGQWKDVTGTDLVWDPVPHADPAAVDIEAKVKAAKEVEKKLLDAAGLGAPEITPADIAALDWGEAEAPGPKWDPPPEGSAFYQYTTQFAGLAAFAKPNPEEGGLAYAVVGPDGAMYADAQGNWTSPDTLSAVEDLVAGWQMIPGVDPPPTPWGDDPDSQPDQMAAFLASNGDIGILYANPMLGTDYWTGHYPAYIGVSDEGDATYAFDQFGQQYEGDQINLDGSGSGYSIYDYIANWGDSPIWMSESGVPAPDAATPDQNFTSIGIGDMPVPPQYSQAWDAVVLTGGDPNTTIWAATEPPSSPTPSSAMLAVKTGNVWATFNKDGDKTGTYVNGLDLPESFKPVDATPSDIFAWSYKTGKPSELAAFLETNQLAEVYELKQTGPSSPKFIGKTTSGDVLLFGYSGQIIAPPSPGVGKSYWAKVTDGVNGVKMYDQADTAEALKVKAAALIPEASTTPGPPKIADPDKIDIIHKGIITSAANKVKAGTMDAGAAILVGNALSASANDPDYESAQKYLAQAMTLAKLGGKQRARYKQLLAEAWGDPVPQSAPTTVKGGSGWHTPMSHKLPAGAKAMSMTAASSWIGPSNKAEANKAKIQVELTKRTQHVPTEKWLEIIDGTSPGINDSTTGNGVDMRKAWDAVTSGKTYGVDYKIAKGYGGNWVIKPPGASYGITSGWVDATPENLDRAIRETAINALVRTWAMTSNDGNPRSLGLQEVARREFGLSNDWIFDWHSAPAGLSTHIKRHEVAYRAFLRAMYDNTQEQLKKTGYTHLRLRRGSGKLYKKDGTGMYHKGQTGSVKLRPMSSYSSKASVANGFGHGTVHEVYVPIERIIGSAQTGFGCTNEFEFVVLGGENEVVIV